MILAAGQGKRLRPITATIPKPLVQVQNKPLIQWHIEKLKAIGITEIIVNGAYLKDKLFAFLQDGSTFGVNIKHSPEENEGLETAGGIIQALPLLGSEPFLVVNGDIFIDGSYKDFLPCPKELITQKHLAHLYLTLNPQHNLKGDYAISKTGLLEYGKDYTFAGVAWYHPNAFVNEVVARLPLRPFFDRWALEHKASASLINQKWFDIGTIGRLQELNEYLEKHT